MIKFIMITQNIL